MYEYLSLIVKTDGRKNHTKHREKNGRIYQCALFLGDQECTDWREEKGQACNGK